ncbi:MAG: M20/M25/M40 family metallo-hydrolase [Anaerolineae bacterium]|nr:M20/M25/M40 family metallo-hydrolase [Anaerolineae bacterium]
MSHILASPARGAERIEWVDVLRGFALFGVLVANMAGYSGLTHNLPPVSDGLNRWIVLLIRFLIEAKFYSLFSLLFGWGMAMQLARAEARKGSFVPLYLKRLFWLLVFGILHGTLIWFGDILSYYALLGAVLLLFRRRSGRVLLVAALICLLFTLALHTPGASMDAFRRGYDQITAWMRPQFSDDGLYATGTLGQITALRAQTFLSQRASSLYTFGPVLAMMLLGLWASKRRLFEDASSHLLFFRRLLWIGLAVGVAGNGVYALLFARPELVDPTWLDFIRVGARLFGAPALMLFYVSVIALLMQRGHWQSRLASLAALGRMSLTNYLMQSAICTLIFYGYGLGLYGEVGATGGLILTIVVCVMQVRFSQWWLDRFQFGPMEWAWRSLTYGRRQPWRVGETAEHIRPLRISSRAIWIAVGVTGSLIAVGVGAWIARPRPVQVVVQTRVVPAQPRATSTPVPAERTPAVMSTPVLEPALYHPGPVVSSGDLLALASTFDRDSALGFIETLTSPPHLGRYAGGASGWAAGEYIAEQFARYGLLPAGQDGSFFQAFPVEFVALAQEPRLAVIGPDGTRYDAYRPYRDFAPILRWYAGEGQVDAPAVWGNACAAEDFARIDTVGKVVLCRMGTLLDIQRAAIEHGAAGVLLLTDPAQRACDMAGPFYETWVPDPLLMLVVYPGLVDELLLGSPYTLTDLSIAYMPFELSTRVQIAVDTVGVESCMLAGENGCHGRNVLGVLPGRDPAYADQVIILGAHYDHMGESPAGTVWAGANDDASGVAVLLEIARVWQEQGYVPRHTVVFAAWDAEERGLVGSSYYVRHPPFPLENTVAMLQFDMVGAGGDLLLVEGDPRRQGQISAIAEALGVLVEQANLGGSDHAPFVQAGVAANLLIWDTRNGQEPNYHRPSDTVEQIDPHKLEAVGRIAMLTVLGITEGQPDIGALIGRRTEAVLQNDLEAFLATASSERREADRAWFVGLQSLAPTEFEIEMRDLRVLGREAMARVDLRATCSTDGKADPTAYRASMEVRFVHVDGGWHWDGPRLIRVESGDGWAVDVTPASVDAVRGLGAVAARSYAGIAALLGLPTDAAATLRLYPDAEALRADTSLTLPAGQESWVSRGEVRLVYRAAITDSVQLADALAQLVLAEAGVTSETASWLWEGLSLVLRTGQSESMSNSSSSSAHLSALQALDRGEPLPQETAAWAAVEYIRQTRGWAGLGEVIVEVGRGQFDPDAFDLAWRAFWQEQLGSTQAMLDALLQARVDAVFAGDEKAFLSTVDDTVPNLMAEQQAWFAGLLDRSLDLFTLRGDLISLESDGEVRALVTLEYAFEGQPTSSLAFQVRFSHLDGSPSPILRWAGAPLETLAGDAVLVRYWRGVELYAQDVLTEMARIYAGLAETLHIEKAAPLTVHIYPTDAAFRAALPLSTMAEGWVFDGAVLKTAAPKSPKIVEQQSALAIALARHLLREQGIGAEWFLRGLSLYLARDFDGGQVERQLEAQLDDLLEAVKARALPPLAEMPAPENVDAETNTLLDAYTWDVIRFGVYERGLDRVADWQQLVSLDGVAQLERDWALALASAYVTPAGVELANQFDPDRAYAHVAYLADPALAGRQAGSPGAHQAAEYIAARFAEYGLVPAVALTRTLTGPAVMSFFQPFPISYTALIDLPRLELIDAQGKVIDALDYRQDFSLPDTLVVGGEVVGDLVLVRPNDWGASNSQSSMRFDGKIVLRVQPDLPEVEVSRAMEHGAVGLIWLGKKASTRSLLAKTPLPVSPPQGELVGLVLSEKGLERLLKAVDPEIAAAVRAPSGVPALSLGVRVRLVVPLSVPQTVESVNVIGLLPGSDPVLSREVIVVGAHYDHVGDDANSQSSANSASSTRLYSGANDDASGVGVLLEIARLWREAGYRPQRSVLFVAWAAQEAGQVGSQYYVAHPVLPLTETVAVLQLDALGGGEGYYLEAHGADANSSSSMRFALTVAEKAVDGRLALVKSAGQSDHLSFHELSIPSMLFTWRGASEENLPNEIADEVQVYRLGVSGRMIAFVLMSLAR